MSELVKLTNQNALQDPLFQNWLYAHNVMDRQAVKSVDLVLKGKSRKGPQTARRIISLLGQNAGYLVPSEDIAQHLFQNQEEKEVREANRWVSYVKQERLRRPDLLYHAPKIGWGLGISSFHLTAETLPIIYRLYQDLFHEVPEEEVLVSVFGSTNPDNEGILRRRVYNLKNKYLTPTTAVLAQRYEASSGNQYYLLTDAMQKKQQEEKRTEISPPYLQHRFQDWLAHPAVGLLKRGAFGENHLFSLLSSLESNTKAHDLMTTLQENKGYIVPHEVLSNLLYGNTKDRVKVKDLIAQMRIKGKHEMPEIYTNHESGVGYSVVELKIPTQLLKLLHLLWHNAMSFNVPVSKNEISQYMTHELEDTSKYSVHARISELRSYLKDTFYAITTEEKGTEVSYKLITKNARE